MTLLIAAVFSVSVTQKCT